MLMYSSVRYKSNKSRDANAVGSRLETTDKRLDNQGSVSVFKFARIKLK